MELRKLTIKELRGFKGLVNVQKASSYWTDDLMAAPVTALKERKTTPRKEVKAVKKNRR